MKTINIFFFNILPLFIYLNGAHADIGINVSPQGTTTQISTYKTNVATNANDENSNTIAITGKAYLPWWNVELPYDVLIKKIIVYNRNVAPERLSNSDVEIRDGTTLVTTSSIGDASSTYTFEFDYGDGVIGNSVKVQKVGSPTTTWLQLAEVEVYGFPLTPSSSPSETTIGGGTSAPVTEPSSDPSTIPSLLPSVFTPGQNWAVYGTASQIGNYSNAYGVAEASRAIDGDNTNGLFGDISSVAVTNKVAVPWWKVEFPYSIIIEKIVVYNRRSGDGCNTDCTARLSNSEVRIMDGETVVDVKSIGDTTNVVAFPFEYGVGGVTGNTVMIQKVGEPFITWLQLAEVEVYGVPLMPSSLPSQSPSNNPSVIASSAPSKSPVPTIFVPTSRPSAEPSGLPYATPSDMPSTEIHEPSSDPSAMPTSVPFTSPSSLPSLVPFADPSSVPFSSPSSVPTSVPFADPSLDPSGVPSFVPSIVPSVLPSILPSVDVPGENWALMGSASQVGDYEDALGFAIASRAIDGNRDNDHFQTQSVSITSRTTNPWWRLDLPFHIIITKIVVFNRGEGSGTGSECDKACTGRLSNSEVRIINDGAVMNTTTIIDAQGVVAFSFDYGEGVEGNSVMIQQVAEPGATWLQLAEVEVYGIVLSPTSAPSTSPTVSSFPSVYTPGENWAPLGNASQISDYEDQLGAAVASRAIDGNRANEHFILQSVAITDRVSLPWWKVDLPFHILITKIVVYNRGIEQTCDVLCTGRLSNSEVRIMDDGVVMDVQNITNTTNVIALPFDYTVYGEGVIGNSVMIQKVGPPTFTWLQLAEVEIYGIPLTPSSSPSSIPTGIPSSTPSISPSISFAPSESFKPTTLLEKPSDVPSVKPSSEPFALPSEEPSGVPYADPSSEPSGVPYTSPSSEPSVLPSSLPSIFRPSENWAPLGNASQISDYADMTGTAIASRAIDRNTANDHFITHSVSITSKTALPWWKVDLPFHILIQKIVVYNRGKEQTCDELCTGRLSNSEVRIMDEGAIVNVTNIGDSTNVIAFSFEYGEGVIGNSVMIQKVGTPSITWLGLAEVEIYGLPSSLPSSTPSSFPSLTSSEMPSIFPSSIPSDISSNYPTQFSGSPSGGGTTLPNDCTFIYNDTTSTAELFDFDINLTQSLYVQKPAISQGYYSLFTEYTMDDRYYMIQLFKDDCRTLPTPSCPIIFYNNHNSITSMINNLQLEFRYNQTLIEESDLWTANKTGGNVDFCIKVTNYFDAAMMLGINFLEVTYRIEVDSLTNFNDTIDVTRIDALDGGVEAINFEEDIVVYQCNDAFDEIVSPTGVTQGDFVQICVETVEGSAFQVNSIKEMDVSQGGVDRYPYIDGFVDSPLAESRCILSNTTGAKCKARLQMLSAYFDERDPEDLDVEGVVKLDYVGRRLSVDVPLKGPTSLTSKTTMSSSSSSRSLEFEESKIVGSFRMTLTVTSDTGESSSYVYTHLEGLFFPALAAFLGWWILR